MKKKLFTLLLLFPLWGLGVLLWGCSDDDDNSPQNPVDQLPDATQTGEGTFACLVDGEAFIADNPYFNCFYQNIDNEYHFGISGSNQSYSTPNNINLEIHGIAIENNTSYSLASEAPIGAFGGGIFLGPNEAYDYFMTNENFTGELTITKLDLDNYIISGTFWMNLQDPFTGETIEIREGRFDTLFIP